MIKDYQPLIAASVALLAAIAAYVAAMKKIYTDADTARRVIVNRKLGIFFRTIVAAAEMSKRAKSFGDEVKKIMSQVEVEERNVDTVSWAWCSGDARDIGSLLPEVDQAWLQLEDFPVEAMSSLQKLRVAARELTERGAKADKNILSKEEIKAGTQSHYGFREPFFSETLITLSINASNVVIESDKLMRVLTPVKTALEAEQIKLEKKLAKRGIFV